MGKDQSMTDPLIWTITVVMILALVAFDYFFHVRKAHIPSLGEAARWSALYVGIAVAFGVLVLVFGGVDMGSEYFAGYVTEKALSVDNLFVFLAIMASFRVPREDQQKVLLFGIVFALIARTGFIFIGATLIDRFSWVFYIFGLILLLTAGNMLGHKDDDNEDEPPDNFIVRIAKRVLPATDHYDGDRLFTIVDGRRAMTPMLLVMVAIGGTDILFALDSIPAIFGLTQDVFIVFTATAFSLLGLRQLFFLIEELLDRLVYLSIGLSAILGFIGIKLVLHALHENELPFINNGEHVDVVEISTGASLLVIIGVLFVTVLASLRSQRGVFNAALANAHRHATAYLDTDYTTDLDERRRIWSLLEQEERTLQGLTDRQRRRIRQRRAEVVDLIEQAHGEHERRLAEVDADVDIATEPGADAADDH
jgi:tellurite resistance protein TerC